jgi:sugar porter (SP) family MFS transporter
VTAKIITLEKSASHTARLALVVSLGGFIFGFDASVISGAIRFVTAEFGLSDIQLGLVVGAPTLGGILTALVAGPLSDLYGRKTLLLAVASLYVVSAVLSALAQSFETLVFARFIGGMAFASLSLAPIYISEVAPARARGRLVSFNQLNIVLGFSAAYFANYFILQAAQADSPFSQSLGIADNTWRWMLGLEIIPAAVWLFSLFLVPESPRWLIINGRETQGRAVLQRLVLDKPMEEEIADIRASAQGELPPLLDRFKAVFGPSMRYALMIGLILAVAQQITGINVVFFYAPSIFEQSGIGTNAAFAQAAIVGIINVVFTVVSMLLIDRVGRKPLLVVGLTGIMASMLLCSWSFHNAEYRLDGQDIAGIEEPAIAARLAPMRDISYASDVAFKRDLEAAVGVPDARRLESELIQAAIDINPTLVLVGILMFVASFAVSLGPVMWVMLPEIFPNRLRGVAMAVTGTVNSGVSFGVQFIFPWQLNNVGASATFLGYALFAVFFLILTVWLIPETKNKTLEELEAVLTSTR